MSCLEGKVGWVHGKDSALDVGTVGPFVTCSVPAKLKLLRKLLVEIIANNLLVFFYSEEQVFLEMGVPSKYSTLQLSPKFDSNTEEIYRLNQAKGVNCLP